MKRHRRVLFGLVLSSILLVSGAQAALPGPSCLISNSSFGNVLANAVFSPQFKADCTLDGQQGNFGLTGYTNAFFAFGGQNTPSPCTKIGARTTYGVNGVLYSTARIENSQVGQWASAVAPANRGIFSGTYYATRPGMYDVSFTAHVSGFNC